VQSFTTQTRTEPRFVADPDPQVDTLIERDLARALETVLAEYGQAALHGIYLVGGFARGEGCVLVRDGEIHLISDYDLVIITKEPTRDRNARSLRERLESILCAPFVEVWLMDAEHLRSRPPMIAFYEMRSAYRTLWGDPEGLRSALPDIDPAAIPLHDGSRTLANRFASLLWAYLQACDPTRPSDAERAQRNYQAVKTILALGDAFLLASRRYHYSLEERTRRIAELPVGTIDEKIMQEYRSTAATKLRPGSGDSLLNGWDVRDRWEWLTDICTRNYELYERLRLPTGSFSWNDYASAVGSAPFGRPAWWKALVKGCLVFGPPRSIRALRACGIPPERRSQAIAPLLLRSYRDAAARRPLAELLGLSRPADGMDWWLAAVRRYVKIWQRHFG